MSTTSLTLSHTSETGDVAGSARAVYKQARDAGYEPDGKAELIRSIEKIGHHHTLVFHVPVKEADDVDRSQ